jgi:hypothetical protein
MLQAEAEPDYNAALPLLRQYVGDALERNPSIQEVLARYRAALQSVPQVTALPDPVFGFSQAIRSLETRVGPQHNGFVLSQAFPWFGKLDLRGKVAVEESRLMVPALPRAAERSDLAAKKGFLRARLYRHHYPD